MELMRHMSDKDKEDEAPLPGFRFHPTDEELVGFYLRRKVEKKPMSIDFIEQVDIYRYDPWDLPRGGSSLVGEKEWYYFSKRGRKYKNSVRPNRVTASGFWKATGIDKPICGGSSRGVHCIGLKKSLVYYRGSAGKGSKTDWMMHEFRLPPDPKSADIPQDAEVWTLCRIFKRLSPYRHYTQEHGRTKETRPVTRHPNLTDYCSKTDSLDSDQTSDHYGPHNLLNDGVSKLSNPVVFNPAAPICTGLWNNMDGGDFAADGGAWDELRSVVEGYTEL